MYKLLLGIGAGIALGATATAWLLGRASAEETRRHADLEQEKDELARKHADLRAEKDRSSHERCVREAEKWKRTCRDELELLRQKDNLIRPDLEQVMDELKRQARSSATDPFRRRLLRRELMRFEEALLRLKAYPLYLDRYEETFNTFLKSSSIGDLLDFGLPSQVLPDFWLYQGKLVLLPNSLLGKPLPDFGHRIQLIDFPSPIIQKNHFYSHEVSPVLIVGQDNRSGIFKGCALKGAFLHDHFLKNIPAEFTVTGTGPAYYRGSMMENSIWAVMPRENTATPGMDKFKGETLNVYLEESNILLDGNYSHKLEHQGKTLPIVSELSPALSATNLFPLFLLMDSDKFEEDVCNAADDARYPFDLRDFKIYEKTTVLVLQKHEWVFYCTAVPDGWLILSEVEKNTKPESRGLSLPFSIVPAELKAAEHLIPNPVGLAHLIEHAGRLSNMGEKAVAASRAVEFFDKWNAVLGFLQEREGSREILFHAEVQNHDKDRKLDLKGNPDKVDVFLKAYERECSEQWCPPLHLNIRTEQGVWRTLCPNARFAEEGRSILFQCNNPPQGTNLYRLNFHTAQHAPLEKQCRALAALRDERFTNPYLREALLLPQEAFYKPKISEAWLQQLSADDVWTKEPSPLSSNQKDVVRGCLSTSPLVLVQGPPGTGKTRCILEIVYQFLAMNPQGRILISSQQNTAVDNVIDRLAGCHGDFLKKNDINILRIGMESKMSETARRYTFEALKQKFADILTQKEKDDSLSHGAKLRSEFAEYIMPMLLSQNQDAELFYCLTRSCRVVAGTCVGLAGKIQALENRHFDLVIIDEAGRAIPSELLIPIRLAEKVILIGDHYQLPPCVAPLLREEEAVEELPFLKGSFLDESFFGTLFEELSPKARFRLTEQYRMDNTIGDLVAELFYTEEGKRLIYNGAQDVKGNGIVRWIDVDGRHEKYGTSLFNEEEIEEVARLLLCLDDALGSGKIRYSSIAIITPYSEQKKRLISKNERLKLKHLSKENIHINTVDQFQGSEADIVVYSTVRTSGTMNFLLDRKRLNVACSRARHALIFIGKRDYFIRNGDNGDNLFTRILSRCVVKKQTPRK